MKAVELVLFVEDEKLEKRIEELEKRCEKINVNLNTVLQTVSCNIPNKPCIDVLLSFADLKVDDIESTDKMKRFINKFKINKRHNQ